MLKRNTSKRSFDDTSTLKMPHLSNRDVKGMPEYRFEVIPFNLTNHGASRNYYFYTVKKRFQKGANRLATNLYHVMRTIKGKDDADCNEAEKQQKFARRVVLMCDNYAENKNNYIFAYGADLVFRLWFDEVEILFGEVGHTHNGNDAVHWVHNDIVGNYESVTLMDYIHFWIPLGM